MARLKSTDISIALNDAKSERRLVRLNTRYDEWDARGHVVGLGSGFVMIAVVNDRIWLDGFECFRRPDIISVQGDPNARFIEKALELRGEMIPEAPPVSLERIEDLLASSGNAFRLVTIHRETEAPDICQIGHVIEVVGGELATREVSPAAEWDVELERYQTSSVTRVSFGADYEAALTLVAGEPPSAP